MASLVSFPQELVDMIFNDLTPADIGKVRRLSKDYNARFGGLYWYLVFRNLRIDLRPSCVERLIQTGERCEVAPEIQHITVHPHPMQELSVSQITPLLAKAFSVLPNIRTIEFSITYGSAGFEYWKPVMDGIIKSKRNTVETVKGPARGIQMSKFKFSANQLKGYQTTFSNLRTLDITASVQFEYGPVAEGFWSFIEKIGSKIEDLTVRTTRTASTIPSPNSHGGYLPRTFSLPKLKKLKLVETAVTPKDMKKLVNRDIEAIDISPCRSRSLAWDWFEIAKDFRDSRLERLQKLRLFLSTYDGDDSYDLPKITIDGSWISEENICRVELRSGNTKRYVTHKSLWNELETHDEVSEFWTSLTNGKWTSNRATRWKRLQSAYDTYKYEKNRAYNDWGRQRGAREQYDATVDQINAEVDSDCEGVE
ncbi:hypothetical protein TWF281_010159 [Arthrobotrys megalospora]